MAGGQAEPPITVRVMVENLRLFASVWPRRPCQTVGTPAETVADPVVGSRAGEVPNHHDGLPLHQLADLLDSPVYA